MMWGLMNGAYEECGSMMNSGWFWGYGILMVLLQVAGIVTLVAIARYFWNKGNEK